MKYKRTRAKWLRPDLYEVTAFAVAAGASRAAVIGFRGPGDPEPPSVYVGDTHVRHFSWPADEGVAPAVAAESLAIEIEEWLDAA